MPQHLKTLYRATLKFKAPLHIGRGSQDDYMGAAAILRDGSGRCVLPGTSIAGVFYNTLEFLLEQCELNESEKSLWQKIRSDKATGDTGNGASRLVFRTTPLSSEKLYVRDKVRIDRRTHTAADGAKYAQWEIDPGKVLLLLEIDNMSRSEELDDQDYEMLETWVGAVFFSWQQDGVFIGGNSATGNGYTVLEAASKFSLETQGDLDEYLENSYFDMLGNEDIWEPLDLGPTRHGHRCRYLKKFNCSIRLGLQNPLLIKGGNSSLSSVNPDSDSAFINRQGMPFIPGSSLRGAISTLMDKYGQREWNKLLGQPSSDCKNPDEGGCVIFTDLSIADKESGKWALIQLERHAQDQFSRAIYEKSKFNEERLFNAEFRGEIMVLDCPASESVEVGQLFGFIESACRHNAISMGSGACHPQIVLEECE